MNLMVVLLITNHFLKKQDFDDNCKLALNTAEEKMGIPAILDYDELSSGKCNDKQLQLYLSLMYNAYREKDLGMTKESLLKRVQELEEKVYCSS